MAAGADSVEVRGELLRDPAAELPALAGLASVYSSPEGLWAEGGWLDSAALARGIAAATTLGAQRLKMSIGDFRASSHGSLWGLKVQLAETRVELRDRERPDRVAPARCPRCRPSSMRPTMPGSTSA